MTEKNKAYLEMVIAAALWSIAGIFIKMINANPFTIAGLRSFFSACVVAVFMALTREKFKISRYSLLASVALMLTFNAFVTANKLTTAANAIVLQFTAPVFILLINLIFFKQRAKIIDVLAVILTLLGISCFFFEEMSSGGVLGNIIAVLAGLFMAFMYVLVGKAAPEEKMSSIFLGHIFTALSGCAVGAILPSFAGSIPEALSASFNIDAMGWICVIILGVFQLGIPYMLVAASSKHCTALAASLIGVLEPLLNPVWVAIFDGEMPGATALAGAVIIIVSVSGWCVLSERKPKHENKAVIAE